MACLGTISKCPGRLPLWTILSSGGILSTRNAPPNLCMAAASTSNESPCVSFTSPVALSIWMSTPALACSETPPRYIFTSVGSISMPLVTSSGVSVFLGTLPPTPADAGPRRAPPSPPWSPRSPELLIAKQVPVPDTLACAATSRFGGPSGAATNRSLSPPGQGGRAGPAIWIVPRPPMDGEPAVKLLPRAADWSRHRRRSSPTYRRGRRPHPRARTAQSSRSAGRRRSVPGPLRSGGRRSGSGGRRQTGFAVVSSVAGRRASNAGST